MKIKEKNKIKIGIVGEHPNNDSKALIALLLKVSAENIDFQVIAKKFRGGVINEQIIAYKHIQDQWFHKANKASGGKGIFFLVIAEMEALILADMKTFNNFYSITAQFSGNPMMVQDPKKKLKALSDKSEKKEYEEADAPNIFEKLDFKTVYKNHKGYRSFQSFADELRKVKIIDF